MIAAGKKEENGDAEYKKMDATLLTKQNDGRVRFQIKEISPALLNAFRRIMINRVPTMAIETVDIIENSSALYDEIIAHRLGLLVLKTDLGSYFVRDLCKCKGEGCARCTVHLTLEAEGPCMVYAEMIKSKDPKIVPVHPKTPIVKLLEGQKIKFIATAQLGRGKDHIKFSPGLLYYQGYPTIKIGDIKNPEAIAEICPRMVFSSEGKKLKVKNLDACTLCMACVDASQHEVSVSSKEEEFIVTIEPWGQLTALEMVQEIHEELDEQLEEFVDEIKKVK